MFVKEYTEEFYRLSIRARHAEDDMEKVAKYINGLIYDIQDEINLLSLNTIEDAYQAGLKVEEKMLRKQNQMNRGKCSVRGRGTTRPRFQQDQNEAGSSSSRTPQRGDFNRGIFAPRGRGRGRDIQCYTRGEWGHGSWDCPHNKTTSQRNVNVAEEKEEKPQITDKEESPEVGESLLLKRALLKAEKETEEPAHMKILFRTTRKSKGKCCKVIIDSGSTDNLFSTEMVDKLGLVKTVDPTPYKVSWLQKAHQIIVTEQCKFDWKAIHDGRKNTYTLEKDGNKHSLLPLKDEADKGAPGNSVTLMSGKELLQEVGKGEEMHFVVIGKPKVILASTNLDDLPEEIKTLLDGFADVIVDELPMH
eukprot:PITA_30384